MLLICFKQYYVKPFKKQTFLKEKLAILPAHTKIFQRGVSV